MTEYQPHPHEPRNVNVVEQELWSIVQAVAETDSTRSTYLDFDDVSCGWCCPFCDGEVPSRMGDTKFPHSASCIVVKARELMRKAVQYGYGPS